MRPDLQDEVCVAITHSGSFVACAVSSELVGIDLEQVGRVRDVASLAQAVCTPHERDRLAVLDPCAQQREFLVMWTLKEAWLKRRHEGMTPGRLAHVETRPTAAAAEGRVWQRDDATLAVVAGAHTSLHWHRDVLGLAGEVAAHKAIHVPDVRHARGYGNAEQVPATVRALFGMGCKAQSAAIAPAMASICNAADRPNQGCAAREGLIQRCPICSPLACMLQ
jgi:hypothetical protein